MENKNNENVNNEEIEIVDDLQFLDKQIDNIEDTDNRPLEEIMGENEYQELYNRALICEVAYFIGKNAEIDKYIQEKIIDEVTGVDEFVLFYIFCEFIVKNVEYKDLQDLYEMIESDYASAVDMFMKTYTDEEGE